MDVVGDDSPINLQLNGNIIETDKTRTLGADDKAAIANGNARFIAGFRVRFI